MLLLLLIVLVFCCCLGLLLLFATDTDSKKVMAYDVCDTDGNVSDLLVM